MKFTTDQIEGFKQTWREKHGEELEDAEARESAARLIGLFQILLAVDTRLRRPIVRSDDTSGRVE